MLRLFGARVSRNVRIYSSARITIPWNLNIEEFVTVGDRAILYALGEITLGAHSTISQNAHICAGTHSITSPSFELIKASIHVGSGVWVAADAFVGPGVKIGDKAVVGARSVVMKDVAAKKIVFGNPAIEVGDRQIT